MIQFQCDYSEGAHPRILERLVQTNLEQTVGYGEDPYCEAARDAVRKACGREDVDVHFLVGGILVVTFIMWQTSSRTLSTTSFSVADSGIDSFDFDDLKLLLINM